MMKRTQQKDAIRNIRKQFISFFSILIVIALGVGIFLACRFASIAITGRGSAAYREANYRDIEIRSTHGITNEDVEAVEKLDQVADAETLFAIDMIAKSGSDKQAVHVISATERMDIPWVVEGKLPQGKAECAIERATADALGLDLGDHLEILSVDEGEPSEFLYERSFEITALITHPDHIYMVDTLNPDILLSKDAFDTQSAGVDSTGMLVCLDTDGEDSFSKDYQASVQQAMRSLAALGRERSVIRDEELLAESEEKISEGEEQLASGKEALDSGREELDDNYALIEDAQSQLKQMQQKMDDGAIDLDSAREELQENKKKLDAAGEQLKAAGVQLKEAKNQLDAGEQELADGKARLDAANAELKEADATLTEKRQELSEAKTKLDVSRAILDTGRSQVDTGSANAVMRQTWIEQGMDEDAVSMLPGMEDLEDYTDGYTMTFREAFHKQLLEQDVQPEDIAGFEAALERNQEWITYTELMNQIIRGEAEYAKGLQEYNDGMAKLAEGEAQYRAGLDEYNKGLDEYQRNQARLEAKKSEYNVNVTLFETNLASYEDGLAQYETGLAKYEEAQRQYAQGEDTIAKKEKEVEEGSEKLKEAENRWQEQQQKYEEGLSELEVGKDALAAYSAGNWILMDRSLNLTWSELSEVARTFRMIGMTFALLFILLGILVCYATIGKIIDEQRKLVGTTKALGFFPGEIFAKYLMFGGAAALLGCIAGVILSFFVLEDMILSEVELRYYVDTFPRYFSWIMAALAVAAGLAVAAFATWVACRRLLAQPAVRLINGEIPMLPVRRKKTGEDRQTSLYRSLILRNIRADLKRVAITVVSIAGCCILLIIGFSLKFSFTDLIDRQFTEIIHYDALVKILPGWGEHAREEIREVVSEADGEYVSMYTFGTLMRIGADQKLAQVVCADPDSLMLVYRLYDVRKKTEMRVPDGGAVIFGRLAEVYHLEVGDHISLLDEDGVYHDVPIAGIYKSYASRTVFLSANYAEELFGERAKGNAFAMRISQNGQEALQKKLSVYPAYLQMIDADSERETYQNTADSMNTVILVMVLMAGIMAAVVLLNLIRIQINQKKRELTIMRINGFTTGETIGYILRENILTTLLGIGIGLVAGNVIAQFNLRAIERVDLQMVRDINWKACLFSVLITLLFAAVINYLTLRKIKKLNLNDVNES